MNLLDFRPLRDQGAQPAGAQGSALAAPEEAVARRARIERFKNRGPRQKGREAAAARGTARGVAMVTLRAGA